MRCCCTDSRTSSAQNQADRSRAWAARDAVYGDLMNPAEPGSGGGAYSTSEYHGGGNGGGLIRIKAGRLHVDGSIIADGESRINTSGWTWSGGSGGGILIHATTLSGSGTISAKGGSSSNGGAGGGGRIAVYYDTLELPVENIIASGGVSASGGTAARNGGAGTIFLKPKSCNHP